MAVHFPVLFASQKTLEALPKPHSDWMLTGSIGLVWLLWQHFWGACHLWEAPLKG